jgi:predicted phosphodiesterase
MADALIENPILNSPFLEPKRHFKFTDDGITNEIVAGRRISSYFIAELKNTVAGSLFMVFGEPDIDVAKKGNDLTVEIKGVDVLSRHSRSASEEIPQIQRLPISRGGRHRGQKARCRNAPR